MTEKQTSKTRDTTSADLAKHARDIGLEHNPQPDTAAKPDIAQTAKRRFPAIKEAAALLLVSAVAAGTAAFSSNEHRASSPTAKREIIHPKRERVELNKKASVTEQAQQMSRELIAGNRITGVGIEVGATVPINTPSVDIKPGETPGKIWDPIRFDETHYGYITRDYDGYIPSMEAPYGQITVHVVEYDGPLGDSIEREGTPQHKVGSLYARSGGVEVDFPGNDPNDSGREDFVTPGQVMFE